MRAVGVTPAAAGAYVMGMTSSRVARNVLRETMPDTAESGIQPVVRRPGLLAPRAGGPAPDFTLPLARGGRMSLAALVEKGPVVVAFHRGGSCPYCELQLRAYEWALPRIRAAFASLVVVSPQTPKEARAMAETRGLSFHVASDVGNVVARRYGLVPEAGDDASTELPVPATFIVGKGGILAFTYVNPDHRERLEPAEIVRVLGKLRRLELCSSVD